MRILYGTIAAGALLLTWASDANSQVSVAVGNPWTGGGVYVGAPLGYSSVYGVPVTTVYSSGYAGVAPYGVPATTVYSSGYAGLAPYSVTSSASPVYGYSTYPAYVPYAYRRGLFGRRVWGTWAAPGFYPW
jgi:hypothetical protein